MNYYNDVLEAIGNTPLVKLNNVTKGIKATVLAKLEFMNPGGSIKDRMAVYMVEKAIKNGKLKRGGTIVENTSGNTGVGLALYAVVNGFKAIFTIPDKMSSEKINLLKAFGAKVIVCPTAVPATDRRSYYETAKRIARETPNSILINQYHNQDNVEAHYKKTGPEIWKQTNSKIDFFVAGIGTGGTISGVGKYLREKNPRVKIIGADPIGSIYYDWFKHKKMSDPKVYLVEGIGEDMLCEALHLDILDDIEQVTDKESFLMARRLVREEGILAGGSSGAAVHVALKIANKLPKNKTVVVILPDTGRNYITKFLNDDWMREKGFLVNKSR